MLQVNQMSNAALDRAEANLAAASEILKQIGGEE
jgi:hypothetical protein